MSYYLFIVDIFILSLERIFTKHMEEFHKSHRKKSSQKDENKNASTLVAQCSTHLDQLNHKLKGYLNAQRTQQLQCVLPSLDTLSSQIKSLKENINHEPTPLEKMQERTSLVQIKEKLLEKIKHHHKQIQILKKKSQKQNITGDQLAREFEENKITIEKYENKEQYASEEESLLSNYPSKETTHRQTLKTQTDYLGDSLCKQNKKNSLPSLFGPSPRSSRSSFMPTIPPEFQTKWSKVDKIFKTISSLNSDRLASSLLRDADPQKNIIKTLLHKNYQVSDKMGQLLKAREVKREWSRLTSKLIS